MHILATKTVQKRQTSKLHLLFSWTCVSYFKCIKNEMLTKNCPVMKCFLLFWLSQSQSLEFSSHVIHYIVLVALSDYQYGVRLVSGVNNKVLITLNARNDHDRQKFVEDLREAILEVIKTHFKRLKFVLIVLGLW